MSQTVAKCRSDDHVWRAADRVDASTDSPFTVNNCDGDDVESADRVRLVTPAVCAVSTATVSLLGLGTCTLTATQGGGGSYNAAADVTRSFRCCPTARFSR